jgi:hypothetical protein
MNWQVNYTLSNVQKVQGVTLAEHVRGDAIRIAARNHPDILAVISSSYTITPEVVKEYHKEFPNMDFLCGYRKECVWEGEAIKYLEENAIGWGSAGTLSSAISAGSVNTAAHKDFFFSCRLIRQLRYVKDIFREFDRIITITLASGRKLRIGMVLEYEPTADTIRSLWDRFGPVDIAWNINPNGNPTRNAMEAGKQLGCEVMKWDELKALLQTG